MLGKVVPLFLIFYLQSTVFLLNSIFLSRFAFRRYGRIYTFPFSSLYSHFLSPTNLSSYLYIYLSIYPGLHGGGLEGNILGKSVPLFLHFYFLSIYLILSFYLGLLGGDLAGNIHGKGVPLFLIFYLLSINPCLSVYLSRFAWRGSRRECAWEWYTTESSSNKCYNTYKGSTVLIQKNLVKIIIVYKKDLMQTCHTSFLTTK